MNPFMLKIFAEIFDVVVSEQFVMEFVKNGSVDVDDIVKHPLLRLNLNFCFVWNYLFKQYPTKQDFNSFLDQYGFNTNSKFTIDKIMYEKMLNAIPLMKLGMAQFLNGEDFIKKSTSFNDSLVSPSIIVNIVYAKLSYRYALSADALGPLMNDNMIVTIINVLKQDEIFEFNDVGKNPINSSINELTRFDSAILEYMSGYEKLQYTITQDLHFMLQLMDNVIIHVDCNDVPEDVLKVIISQYDSCFQKHIALFNCKPKWHDDLYCFDVTKEYLHVLPSIAKCYMIITHDIHPTSRPLSYSYDNAIIYTRFPYNLNTPIEKFMSMYDKQIVNTLEAPSIKAPFHQYTIFDVCKDRVKREGVLSCCIVSGVPESVVETIQEKHKHVEFIQDASLADVVVHLDAGVQDSLLYLSQNSIPFVGTANKYIHHMVNGVVSNSNDIEDDLRIVLETKEIVDILQKGVRHFRTLQHVDFISCYWKHYITNTCPLRTTNPRSGILVYCDFVIKYFISRLEQILSLEHHSQSPNCVILVDNRGNMLSVLSILFTMLNLNESWSCIIYTSAHALDFYNKWLGSIASIRHSEQLDVKRFHIDVYNKFMTSEELWSCLDYDKCLVVQDDGVILRPGIEKFMEYDYVGAPWVDSPPNDYIKEHVNSELVGNGGLSLRSVNVMKDIVTNWTSEKKLLFFQGLNNIPEDVYFVKHAKLLGAKLPSMATASLFSSEEMLNSNSVGFHKVWAYQHPNNVKTFFDAILARS
jgi:hypothetical protein